MAGIKEDTAAYSTFDKLWAAIVLQENEHVLLRIMASFMMVVALIVHLIVINGINIPYGKHTSTKWGFLVQARFAWIFMEIWSFFIPIYMFFNLPPENDVPFVNIFLLSLFVFHYTHRSLIYPFRKNKSNAPMPIMIMILATMFTSYNGYMQSAYLLRHAEYGEDWIHQPNFIIGVLLFIIGMHTNIICDNIMTNLRKPNSRGYKIPYGNMFEYVCCGNLFGECVEWTGWALACWSPQAAAFAIFTVLMLSAKSYSTYNWYVKKFDNFPKNRKVFIPFIF